MMATPIAGGPRFEAGVPQPLFNTGVTQVLPYQEQYRNSPDGKRFLVALPAKQGSGAPITIVLNWTSAIAR